MVIYWLVRRSNAFSFTIRATIIQDNINPITKVEKSALLLASTIFNQPPANILVDEDEIKRLTGKFPELLATGSDDGVEIYQD